jgi:hypothetical protein
MRKAACELPVEDPAILYHVSGKDLLSS